MFLPVIGIWSIYEEYESGSEEGEEVVISDMGRYREREVLTIK